MAGVANEATKEFVEKVNFLRSRRSAGPLSWNTAVKFLMARKFDVTKAIDLYEAHETIRYREGLYNFDPTRDPLKAELETGKFTILPTRDFSGAAIALFTARLHHPELVSHQTTLQGVVYQLDVALESVEAQRNGLVFIYDMTGSKYSNFDNELSEKILNMLKGGYPARLKKVLIVTAPLWFRVPFKILRLFVPKKLRDRVYTTSLSELALHIPTNSLPRHLGGTLQYSHKDWLLHCLKSMANRREDFVEMASLYAKDDDVIHLEKDIGDISDKERDNYQAQTSEVETDESSEMQHSIHEKYNTEDREKEVEVIKDESSHHYANHHLHNGDITSSDIETSPSKEDSTDTSPQENHPLNKPLPPLPRKKRPSGGNPGHCDSIHEPEDDGMTIEELVHHIRLKGRKGLYKEYALVKAAAPEGNFDISKSKLNMSKNRYTDVLCYDHSRVGISSCEGDPHSDYINANFVDGYKQKNAFICTQGPLPKTFPDFWKMVWEQQVLIIVMTTRTLERNRAKCGQYWPNEEDATAEYGQFVIINNGVQQHKDYIITSLFLHDTKSGESREITHFQFTGWPDYGVPHSAIAMLDFLFKVKEYQSTAVKALGPSWIGHPLGPPIIIHCSAGIGRTGTFCTLDICIRRLEDIGTVDVLKTVQRIRSQRAFSIQMPDQYVFCHLALIEYAQNERLIEDVDLSGFDDSDSESD